MARPSALAQLFFIALAYILLTIAFLTNDFSIAYVAANSHPQLPFIYRMTAVWGAHEGSILLWILILGIWTNVFASFYNKKNTELMTLTVAFLGFISFLFLAFLLWTSNPFLAVDFMKDPQDLNPLLQDPGFVIHPPMLYAGYVGFSVAFAITQAALFRGCLNLEWAVATQKFAIAAWCFLTLGIMLGSWWAYRVLGWGGFWFWDPVENASLLPWLSGTALIHILMLSVKRNRAHSWAALLAIITFALSLLGTFLVRSGMLVSAHTFANDPTRGIFLLLLFASVFSTALSLYLFKTPSRKELTDTSSQYSRALGPREMMLLINSILLFVAMLTILLGTLYPLILDAFHLGAISVGAPYFNTVMIPLVLMAMVFMALSPFCAWEKPLTKMVYIQAGKKILFSFGIAMLFAWYMEQLSVLTILTLTLSIWIITTIFTPTSRLKKSMAFAHIGFSVLMIGIMLSTVLNEDREVRIRPGNVVSVGPYQFFFISTEGIRGSNYRGIRASFEVIKNTRHIVNLYPEKRIYPVRDMVMTRVDIHPGIFRDLYLALGEPLEHEYWSVRIYYKPFIRWIWLGAILMIIGGLLSLFKTERKLA